jgi:pilus assembly protein CpaE
MSIIVVVASNSPLTSRLREITDVEVVAVKPGLADNVLKSMLAANRNVTLTLVAEDIDEHHLEELGFIVMDYFSVPVVLCRDGYSTLPAELRKAGYVEVFDSASADVELHKMVNRHLGIEDATFRETTGDTTQVKAPSRPEKSKNSSEAVTEAVPSDPKTAAERLAAIVPSEIDSPSTTAIEPRVIVVMCPKGGVGKTTISTNLAVALAQRAPLDALIVDFDSQFGDVASVLNINAAHTLENAFTEDGVQSGLVVKGLLNTFQDNLLVLAGSDSPAALEKITSSQESQLLAQLSSDYTYVVVDTGSGLTDETLAALEIATDVLFVTTMDISAVKALRRAIDLLDRIDLLPRNRHLVVNMVEPGTGLEVEDISRAMRMPVDAVVPRSVEIALSINLGKPVADSRQQGELAHAVRGLVTKLAGEQVRSARKGGLKRRER